MVKCFEERRRLNNGGHIKRMNVTIESEKLEGGKRRLEDF